MVDSVTPTYHWIKPEVGGSNATWGAKLNGDLDLIDGQVATNAAAIAANASAIAAVPGAPSTGGGTQNLTASDGTFTPPAGKIGEPRTTGLTAAVADNASGFTTVASLTLTAGVWDLWATIYMGGAAAAEAQIMWAWLNTSNTVDTPLYPDLYLTLPVGDYSADGGTVVGPLGRTTITLTGSITLLLLATWDGLGTSDSVTWQGVLSARRVA